MTEVEQAEAAAITAILEELHQFASEEITRLEAAMPQRLAAAEQTVQDWAHDAVGALHSFVARIDSHRGAPSAPSTTTPGPARPAASSATTTPASTASATAAASSTSGTEAAK
jgi:hypothetical protein